MTTENKVVLSGCVILAFSALKYYFNNPEESGPNTIIRIDPETNYDSIPHVHIDPVEIRNIGLHARAMLLISRLRAPKAG
jgi:hypothetical protein